LPRLLWLVLGLGLSLPSLASGWTVLTSSCFLAEFLSEGRWRLLSALTPPVAAHPLPVSVEGRPVPADLYLRARLGRGPALVLVHGLSPDGKDDPRLRRAASLLARHGWAVAVPTVEGLTVLRFRPDDALTVVATIEALRRVGYGAVAVLGVSLGTGPALLAAAEPRVASSVSAVLALGGYASAVELLRYTLTGAYAFDGVNGRRPVNDSAIAQFARANAELVDDAARRLVDNRDPRSVDRLVAELPPATRRLLAALSPEREVARIRAPLFLIHGRDDPAVPFTESLRLQHAAHAAGRAARLVLVGSLGHVEPDQQAGPLDLVRLWAAFYVFGVLSGEAGGTGLTSVGRGS